MERRVWSREELLLTLNLYCKLPFSKYDSRTPEVQALASIIGRTSGAVAMKLANFASLDMTHRDRGVKGLGNVSKADVDIWNSFIGNWNELALESEQLLESLSPSGKDNKLEDTPIYSDVTTEKEQIVKVRLGQRFFRTTVLANYRYQCAICGLPISDLLVASHIIPWSHSYEHRLNPQNELCLCSLHDRAFDRGYITLSNHYEVTVSQALTDFLPSEILTAHFITYDEQTITLPEKFAPRIDFLEHHRSTIFLG